MRTIGLKIESPVEVEETVEEVEETVDEAEASVKRGTSKKK